MSSEGQTWRHLLFAAAVAWLAVGAAARADVLDDARRTFRTDVSHFFQKDVPHFFQDDIPCAFGGQPTSHARTSCPGHVGKHAARKKSPTRHAAAPAHPPVVTTGAGMPPDADPPPNPDHLVATYVPPASGPMAARAENREVALAVCGGDGFVLIGEKSGRDEHGRWFRLDYGCLAKDDAPWPRPSEEASRR